MIHDTCTCGAQVEIGGNGLNDLSQHRKWLQDHLICRTQRSEKRYDERDLRMYLEAQKRYMDVTDAVFSKLAEGDVPGLIQYVMDVANGCDYVDDQLMGLAALAARRFSPPVANPQASNVGEVKP